MSMTRHPQSPYDPQFVPYRCNDCGFTVHHPVYVRSLPECPKCLEAEMDAVTERAKRMAVSRLADDLERLCCAETESEFFKYVTDRNGSIIALLRVYAASALTPAVRGAE